MRLLLVTQAIDRADLSLGFFHRWAELFAEQFEAIEIVCLKEGEHALPKNVRVHSLGKPADAGATKGVWARLQYGLRFYRYIFSLKYDAVLVHMNEEYVVLGGLFWRLRGKRLGMWRNHVQGNWKAAIACRLADVVFYTSPNTYASRFAHAHRMPTGIDLAAYAGENSGARKSLLSLGRIDPVKKVGELLAALKVLHAEGVPFHAAVYGTATPGREAYGEGLKEEFETLQGAGVLERHAGVKSAQVPALFLSHRVFVNLTPPGSFDKTIFEAMAAGCLVVAANPGVREEIGELFVESLAPEEVARALRAAVEMSEEERIRMTARLREYVRREHSLQMLVERVSGMLK